MPLLKLETSVQLTDAQKMSILPALSKVVASSIGKPEQYVMVAISPAAMLMAGKPGDAAFVDVRSIGGLSPDVNRKLSKEICQLLKSSLGIQPDRIYLNFADIDAANWGHNGTTFG